MIMIFYVNLHIVNIIQNQMMKYRFIQIMNQLVSMLRMDSSTSRQNKNTANSFLYF